MANYYLDANALIKSSSILQGYKKEQGIVKIQQLLEQSNTHIFYSSLTLLETWKVIYTEYRKGTFGVTRKHKKKILNRILAELNSILSKAPFEKLNMPMSEAIICQAQAFITQYGEHYAVGSMDMQHVALVKNSAVEAIIMISSDRGVKNICECENIAIFDPEK